MYINTFSSEVTGIRRYLRGVSEKATSKLTTIGECKGINITVEAFKSCTGELLQKRYTLWNNEIRLVWYKNKNKDGKFEVLV